MRVAMEVADGATETDATPAPPAREEHDHGRLINLAGSMVLRASVPELPTVNIFAAQGDPDAYAVTCPTPLSNRIRLI